MKIAILDDWGDTLRELPCFDLLADHDVTVLTGHHPDPADLAARIAEAEAVILFRERTAIGTELLDRLPNLRVIALAGATGHIDLDACAARGIRVEAVKAGATPPDAAAEHALALILAWAKRLPRQLASLRAGHWQSGVGRTLRGLRLGLWGHGRIGRAVAGYAEALGLDVVWWGSDAARARVVAEGGKVAPSRAAFFAEADIVSLHVRLVAETRGMVTVEDLARMKPSACLVNTSRAGLIAPGALEAALAAGRPGHAALDVFETEPLTDPAHPLLTNPNVIATPHIGFVTQEELERQFRAVFARVAEASGPQRG
ncbi:MAG: D-2-hydroxyacid dehydrogenase family protein [Pseudomonadota bacterium]